MKQKEKGKRINTSILSNVERKFINWMLPKFPNWITPDILTLTAFLSGILILTSYYLSNYGKYFLFIASFFIIVHWFADSHDGGLARFRKTPRPNYGYYIDHVLDMATVFFIFLGLLLYGLDFKAVFLLFSAFTILSYHSILCYQTKGHLQLSFGKISPTEARIFIILINLLLFFALDKYAVIVFYLASIIIFILSIYQIIYTARQLDQLDRKEYWR